MPNFLTFFLDLLFPARCLGCKAQGALLCEACISKSTEKEECRRDRTRILFSYQQPLIQQALWRLKYRQKRQIAEAFGPYLYREIVQDLGEEAAWRPGEKPEWLVIPVPTSKKRELQKGYNQAAELAQALAHCDRDGILVYQDSIEKSRETPSQLSMKNRAERLKNLAGSFIVRDERLVKNKTCILVDDITTTGATLQEGERALLAAGARKVIALAVAG